MSRPFSTSSVYMQRTSRWKHSRWFPKWSPNYFWSTVTGSGWYNCFWHWVVGSSIVASFAAIMGTVQIYFSSVSSNWIGVCARACVGSGAVLGSSVVIVIADVSVVEFFDVFVVGISVDDDYDAEAVGIFGWETYLPYLSTVGFGCAVSIL